jgi:hypothetical protein
MANSSKNPATDQRIDDSKNTIPRTMSKSVPSPRLLTILLAINPEMSPKIIQAGIAIETSVTTDAQKG